MLNISSELFWLTLLSAVVWLASHKALSHFSQKVFTTQVNDVENVGARYGLASVLRTIASICTVTGGVLIGLAVLAKLWLNSHQSNVEDIKSLVEFRGSLEQTLTDVAVGSSTTWFVLFVCLVVFWIVLKVKSSNSKWNEAYNLRKEAITKLLATENLEYLTEMVNDSDEFKGKAESRIELLRKLNDIKIKHLLQVPCVSFEEGKELSLENLYELRQSLSNDIENINALINESPEDVSTEDKEKLVEQLAYLEQFHEAVRGAIGDVENSVNVEIFKLDNSTQEVPLSEVEQALEHSEDELYKFYLELACEMRMQNHEQLGNEQPSSEPELLHQWVGNIVTGEQAVKGASNVSRLSARVAIVALLVSLVGFNAGSMAGKYIEASKSIELALIEDSNANTLAELSAQHQSESNDAVQSQVDEPMASDSQTAAYIRNAYRVNVGRSIVKPALSASVRQQTRRAAFELAAVRARQAVLVQSGREIPPSYDQTTSRQQYRAIGNASNIPADIDAPINRQIDDLKKNKPLWLKLRQQAAKPSSVNSVNRAVFRAAFINIPSEVSHASRVYAHQSAAEFAQQIVKDGAVPDANGDYRVSSGGGGFSTDAERKVMAEYHSQVPSNIQSEARRYQSGQLSSGSLNRVVARTSVGGGQILSPNGANYSSYYDKTFGSPSGAGGSKTSLSARSYNKIRFSGKVGGVVIGREPSKADASLDVVGLEWTIKDNQKVSIMLKHAGQENFVEIGEFDMAIVHQAMAYAADGRVVTTTLPQYRPNRDSGGSDIEIEARRVVVHPALEDTYMACPAIQIDRFVDAFMFEEGNSDTDLLIIQSARGAVTQLGLIMQAMGSVSGSRKAEVIEMLGTEGKDQFITPIKLYLTYCGTSSRCLPISEYEKLGFEFDGAASWLSCLQGSSFASCERRLAQVKPKASFAVDSGVREVAYDLDSDFDFLKIKERQNPLWPLDFIVQAVPQTLDDKDVDIKDDWSPWIFPSVADKLRSVVYKGIKKNTDAKQVFSYMQQFVVLQRMFRLSLSGKLGFDFPLEKLALLQAQTKEAVKAKRHEKWNINGNFVKVVRTKADELKSLLAQEPDKNNCSSKINAAVLAQMQQPWPESDDIFKLVGGLDDLCPNFSPSTSLSRLKRQLSEQNLIDDAIYLVEQRNNPNNSRSLYCEAL